MGFRFRRSLKVVPGVKLNVGGRSASVSFGVPGATANVSPKGTSLTVGVPGTGISYRARSAVSSLSDGGIVELQHSIGSGDGLVDQQWAITPEETTFRLAALLASVSLGGADAGEVEARIAGTLPERLPNGLSAPLLAKAMVASALRSSGTSRGGTAAIRKTLREFGVGADTFVAQAVAAVRASEKLRFARGISSGPPLQYIKGDNGSLVAVEFEPPSVRARLPSEALADLHSRQLQIGRQRLLNPDLMKAQKSSHVWTWAVLAALFTFVFAFLASVSD